MDSTKCVCCCGYRGVVGQGVVSQQRGQGMVYGISELDMETKNFGCPALYIITSSSHVRSGQL